MENVFLNELEKLREDVLTMMRLSQQAVDNAIRAMVDFDAVRARDVIDSDVFINDLECSIDAESLKLLALKQPVAGDLRFVVGCMRLTVNVERLGDEAVNIAERTLILLERPKLPPNPAVVELAALASNQVRDVIIAFSDLDAEAAKRIYARAAVAPSLTVRIIKENAEFMIEESRMVERALQYSFIAHNLKRVCDQTSNIAESIIFIREGENYKHSSRGLSAPYK